jgi:hypothetical protein
MSTGRGALVDRYLDMPNHVSGVRTQANSLGVSAPTRSQGQPPRLPYGIEHRQEARTMEIRFATVV